jgi:hypothetical protein
MAITGSFSTGLLTLNGDENGNTISAGRDGAGSSFVNRSSVFGHVKAWYLGRLYLNLQRIEEQAAFAGHGFVPPRIPVWRGNGARFDLAARLATLAAVCILPARRLLIALHASRRRQAGLVIARYRHLSNEIECHVAAGPILTRRRQDPALMARP